LLYNLCVFFPDEPVPLEVVREVAALLKAADLGEIALESKSGGNGLRLKIERETFVAAPVSLPVVAQTSGELAEDAESFVVEAPVAFERTEVVAPCVGVFRSPKKPLSLGDQVKARQLVGSVESLRVPNEVYAPFDGRVVEMPVVEGQGVEWGQVLLVLEPSSS
jgi:acetyl-CoA carboxylase biotin carboxyl carrier protein